MSTNPKAPYFVLTAVMRLYPQLPELIGTNWPDVQPQIDTYITALQANPEAYLESTQLFGLLARYEAARQAFTAEMSVQETVTHKLTAPLAEMGFDVDDGLMATLYAAMDWDVDPDTVPTPEEDLKLKSITMKDGGVNGGRSVKFRNLDIDLSKMMTMSAGFFMTGENMLNSPKPFVIAAGVLMLVGTLLTEMTQKIEQQEATVFWGFITATDDTPKDRRADTDTIFTTTNAERHKRGLPELTRQQFDHSLYKLVQLGSIARTEGETYKIIEKFKVKG